MRGGVECKDTLGRTLPYNKNDCGSAAAYILSLLRKEDEFGGKQNVMDFSKIYGASAKTLNKINNQKRRSPFAGGSNPFRRR